VPAEEPLADQLRVCREGPGLLERHLPVSGPLVEARHQRALARDREYTRIVDPLRDVFVQLAVIRRVGPGIGNHAGESGALAFVDPRCTLLECLTRIAHQLQKTFSHVFVPNEWVIASYAYARSIRKPLPITTNSLISCASTAMGSDSAPAMAATTNAPMTTADSARFC